jgi:hypothetical protein
MAAVEAEHQSAPPRLTRTQLAAGLEMYETVIDMSDTSAAFDVRLTPATE